MVSCVSGKGYIIDSLNISSLFTLQVKIGKNCKSEAEVIIKLINSVVKLDFK